MFSLTSVTRSKGLGHKIPRRVDALKWLSHCCICANEGSLEGSLPSVVVATQHDKVNGF